MINIRWVVSITILVSGLAAAFSFAPLSAQTTAVSADKPFVVEYYYKTKWGHADEFLKLFKKNHYPVLKKIGRAHV